MIIVGLTVSILVAKSRIITKVCVPLFNSRKQILRSELFLSFLRD